MAKVFTITPGLENMGAMRTGGQGSVYKGRRVGEIITAIKLLPTPIFSESEDDKNYRDFKNEVEKLKRVNREPNANVVKILSSGLSETGNFPFIEMEYIEGPDVEELLQPPQEPVFTIKEVIKVAEHLSNALAHCHRNDVKHGDIKSNNVKFNLHTGNYVLLDFGLAALSDEQRRSSLRHAGAVEFMAPEQNEGQILSQTDVYSFGVILFELLAGRVPFPLQDKGETARNTVRLAHIETPAPDVTALRKEMLPANWSLEKRSREGNIPAWLLKLVYKCLEKDPQKRFANGMELHEFVTFNSTHLMPATDNNSETYKVAPEAHKETNKDQLQQQLLQYRQQLLLKEREINELKAIAGKKGEEIQQLKTQTAEPVLVNNGNGKGASKTVFIALLLLTIGLAAITGYSYFKNSKRSSLENSDSYTQSYEDRTATNENADTDEGPEVTNAGIDTSERVTKQAQDTDTGTQKAKVEEPKTNEPPVTEQTDNSSTENTEAEKRPEIPQTIPSTPAHHQYMVVAKAYFYNEADESTRRNIFIIPSNNAIVEELDRKDDFVYVTFTNSTGQQFKGWLRKRDLQPLNE